MKNKEWLNRFLEDCKFRSCSQNTIIAYTKRLTDFLDYIEPVEIVDVKRVDCMDFIVDLGDDRNMSASSVRSYITALKAFGRFIEADLWDQGWRNVFGTLRYPKAEQYKPFIMTPDEVAEMMSSMPSRSATQMRDKAIVSLLYSSGLRASELSDLVLGDINLDERTVHVRHGKGDKERWSFASEQATKELRLWLEVRDQFCHAYETERVFIGRGSDHLSRMSVYSIVTTAGKRVYLEVTPHTLRRSRATHLRESGAPVDVVQKMLGHSSPVVTTQSYVKLDPAHIRDMVEGSIA